MINLIKNKTALPVKDHNYASCNSSLRSGGVVFNLREYDGSVDSELCHSRKVDISQLTEIGSLRACRIALLGSTLQVSNPAIPILKSITGSRLNGRTEGRTFYADSPPASLYHKITSAKQFLSVCQKWSMEDGVTLKKCPALSHLTTGNLSNLINLKDGTNNHGN